MLGSWSHLPLLAGYFSGNLSLGFRVRGVGVGAQRKSDKQFQDPKDRKAWGQRLPVSKHWPMAPWRCAAVIQERADKGISDVRVFFFFLILSPEKMHGQE